MSEETEKQDDEINIIDIIAILWRWKIMIIAITALAAIGVVWYSLVSARMPPETSYRPNQFTARAFMLINSSTGGSTSVTSSGAMGTLASLVGLNVSTGTGFTQLAIYLTGSNTMLDAVVEEFDLIRKHNIVQNPKTSSRNLIRRGLSAGYDGGSGVFSISFTHIDPVFASKVVDFCTDYLADRFDELGLDKNKIQKENLENNIAHAFQEILRLDEERRSLERSVALGTSFAGVPAITAEITRLDVELGAQRQIYNQLKIQYELLKVEMASEKPVFQILERAEVPEVKSGPDRRRLCIIVTVAAGIGSVFLAFILNALLNVRKDPEAMRKLRGKREK